MLNFFANVSGWMASLSHPQSIYNWQWVLIGGLFAAFVITHYFTARPDNRKGNS